MAMLELIESVRELCVAVELLVLPDISEHLRDFALEGLVAFQPGLVARGSLFAGLAFVG